MRLKVDENLPGAVAQALRDRGYEASTVHEESLSGGRDSVLADVCQREGKVRVTLDRDFADVRNYPPSRYAGLILLRPRSQGKQALLKLVTKLMPLLAREPLVGKLWIVSEGGVRIRG